MDNQSETKFKRVAKRRAENALKQIRLLRNCAGQGYSFNATQVDTIFKALQSALDSTKSAFEAKKDIKELPEIKL